MSTPNNKASVPNPLSPSFHPTSGRSPHNSHNNNNFQNPPNFSLTSSAPYQVQGGSSRQTPTFTPSKPQQTMGSSTPLNTAAKPFVPGGCASPMTSALKPDAKEFRPAAAAPAPAPVAPITTTSAPVVLDNINSIAAPIASKANPETIINKPVATNPDEIIQKQDTVVDPEATTTFVVQKEEEEEEIIVPQTAPVTAQRKVLQSDDVDEIVPSEERDVVAACPVFGGNNDGEDDNDDESSLISGGITNTFSEVPSLDLNPSELLIPTDIQASASEASALTTGTLGAPEKKKKQKKPVDPNAPKPPNPNQKPKNNILFKWDYSTKPKYSLEELYKIKEANVKWIDVPVKTAEGDADDADAATAEETTAAENVAEKVVAADDEPVPTIRVISTLPPDNFNRQYFTWAFKDSPDVPPPNLFETKSYHKKGADGKDGKRGDFKGGRGGAAGGAGGRKGPIDEALAAKIKMSEAGYKVKRDVQGDEKKIRDIQMILNKLSDTNVSKLADQTKEVGLDSMHLFETIIQLLFNKAISEPNFAPIYAHYCSYLRDMALVTKDDESEENADAPSTPNPEDQDDDDAVTSTKEEQQNNVSFKKRILDIAQQTFEENKFNQLSAKEVRELPDDEQLAIATSRRKYLGAIKFVGELYKRRLLPQDQLWDSYQRLKDNMTNEDALEALCHLFGNTGKIAIDNALKAKKSRITTIDGSILETDVPAQIREIRDTFVRESKNKEVYAPRMRYMMMDSVDLFKKWLLPAEDNTKQQQKKEREEEKKIEKEKQRRQQEQEAKARGDAKNLTKPTLANAPSSKSSYHNSRKDAGKPGLINNRGNVPSLAGQPTLSTIDAASSISIQPSATQLTDIAGDVSASTKNGFKTPKGNQQPPAKENKFKSNNAKNNDNNNNNKGGKVDKDGFKGAKGGKDDFKTQGGKNAKNQPQNNKKGGKNAPVHQQPQQAKAVAAKPAAKAKVAANNKFAGFFDDDDEEEDEEEAAAAEEEEEVEEETDPLATLGRIQTDAPSNNASVDPLAASIAEVRSFDREQLESIERKIVNSWQDYDYSQDQEDVEYTFKDVKEDDRYLIAYQFFAGVADRKKGDIDELIKHSVVYQYFPVTTEQWERGFKLALTQFNEILCDKPIFFEVAADMLKKLKESGKLVVDAAKYDELFEQALQYNKDKFVSLL